MKSGARLVAVLAALLVTLASSGSLGQAADDKVPHYEIVFEARILPTERIARATWTLGVGASAVRELNLRIDPERHFGFQGDGEVTVAGAEVTWLPPETGGSLRYRFRIDSMREGGGYEARGGENWALFRGDALFPPARTRTLRNAHSISVLKLQLPRGWSAAVPYTRSRPNTYEVNDPLRRFDRPTGWMVVGKIGVLRERVAGTRLAVAGPRGQGVRRQDMLAFLRWNLPELRTILTALPDRLLVVSAGDPFWRGGLSGPRSVFVHADRPLIASDGTSPLLHEVFHSATRTTAGRDGDWVVEGLAEYYSLELMLRSRTMSRRRHERALTGLERRARGARLAGADSSGAATARAVLVLRALDLHIRQETEEERSLDDVVALLATQLEPVTTNGFRAAAEKATGLDLAGFFQREVGKPGRGR